MSVISIQKMGITDFGTDAIVNAANTQLAPGAGVCGAIFKAAGYDELDAACKKIGGCKTGKAVITQGFNLLAKHVIHTVGPIWNGGSNNEPQLLYSAYKQSLFVARDNKLHSITFPLISAGIYGYPIDKAWRKALQACADFIMEHEDEHYAIIFAVLDQKIMDAGVKEMRNLLSDNKYKDFEGFSNARDIRRDDLFEWARKYYSLYVNNNTEEAEVDERSNFADDCFRIGLKMDCGNSFVAMFGSEAFNSEEGLMEKINMQIDPVIIADGIFSQWRYITHWAMGNERLLDDDIRPWFTNALDKVMELTMPRQ